MVEARLLCEFIQVKLAEFEALTAAAAVPSPATASMAAGASGIPALMGTSKFTLTPIMPKVEVAEVDWSISRPSAF
jgi:hypothetical protein